MFSFNQRIIKTREGKIYSSDPEDFEDHGSFIVYKGFLSFFRHNIHKEIIVQDYERISYTMYLLLFLVIAILVGGYTYTQKNIDARYSENIENQYPQKLS